MQLQSFIVLLSLVSSPILSLSTTQQSGAGPHVGAVLGRLPSLAVTVPAISIANASSSIKSRNFGLARIVGQGSVQKRTSIADEAAGIQSAVYAIIVSISSGLSSANSLISGSTNVSFASQNTQSTNSTPSVPATDSSDDSDDDGTCVPDDTSSSSSTDSSSSTSSSDSVSSPSSASVTASATVQNRVASPTSTSQVYSNAYATFFTQNGVAGNCGTVNPDSAHIVALTTSMYGNGSLCGKTVTITRVSNGAQIVASVADSCPSCPTSTSLDLSVGAFNMIATPEEGMVAITWQFNN